MCWVAAFKTPEEDFVSGIVSRPVSRCPFWGSWKSSRPCADTERLKRTSACLPQKRVCSSVWRISMPVETGTGDPLSGQILGSVLRDGHDEPRPRRPPRMGPDCEAGTCANEGKVYLRRFDQDARLYIRVAVGWVRYLHFVADWASIRAALAAHRSRGQHSPGKRCRQHLSSIGPHRRNRTPRAGRGASSPTGTARMQCPAWPNAGQGSARRRWCPSGG